MDENNKNELTEEFLDQDFLDTFGNGEELKKVFEPEADSAPEEDAASEEAASEEAAGEQTEEEKPGKKGRPARKKG